MKERVELQEAYQFFDEYIKPIQEIEYISIYDALARILAQDIVSTLDQPPFHKSAVDGYAFHYEESEQASKEFPLYLEVIDQVYAGDYCTKQIQKGQAIQIMTGACVPESCTCVIRLEDTNDSIEHLEIYQPCKCFDNICLQGEDFKKGDILLKKGQKLDPISLGVLSSIGMEKVAVYSKPKIALCITGSEVTQLGNVLQPGKIYDSNAMLLSNRLKQLGYDASVITYIEDDETNCAKTFIEYAKKYDLIISTGAVSVGKKDIIHPVLDQIQANKIFWRVKLKPGTPAIFSMIDNTPIISLSGNPFAAISTFELLARKILYILTRDPSLHLSCKKAILTSSFHKKSKQRRFIRAIYKDGKVSIPSGIHSSNALGSLIGCNALIDVEAGNEGLNSNDEVSVWVL